ncbi:MAG: cytochrome c oxidase subunit I, partial [Stygiobacter sp.]
MANGNTVAENFYHQSTNKHKGILSWLLTVDHKRIGLMYLISVLTFFVVGIVIGLLMRLELIAP